MLKKTHITIKPNNETFDDLTEYELFIMKHAIGLDYSKDIQIKTNFKVYRNFFFCPVTRPISNSGNVPNWLELVKKKYAVILTTSLSKIIFAVSDKGFQAISNNLNKNIKIRECDYFINHQDSIMEKHLRFGIKSINHSVQ